MQFDHVLAEAHQHFRRGLPADAAAQEVVFLKELRVLVEPPLGDGVTHENHVGAHVAQRFVHLGIGPEPRPVPVEKVGIGLAENNARPKQAKRT